MLLNQRYGAYWVHGFPLLAFPFAVHSINSHRDGGVRGDADV